jgi:hypothetical protein
VPADQQQRLWSLQLIGKHFGEETILRRPVFEQATDT